VSRTKKANSSRLERSAQRAGTMSAMTPLNRRVVLVRRPEGTATPDCFAIEDQPLPPLQPGAVRVAVEYVSVDAGTRTMLRGEGFHQQVGLGEVVLAGGVGRVVESADDELPVGQAVRGGTGVQTLATINARMLGKVDDTLGPLSVHLNALGGSTGVTAWIGVREVAKPQAGESFVVSAAAGAVGSLVGQIAKRDGAYVIGIAGGPAKCRHLIDALGFDAAIDYKNEDVTERLRELCPGGVNVFFDNVGGTVLDAVLDHLALRARVIICGAVTQYDDMDHVVGPSRYLRLAERQSRMEGFAFFHFPERIAAATEELSAWVREGSLVAVDHVLDGIEQFPHALEFMFSGGNTGKLLVKLS
jgi:NADPH-dependent curcumin reductase